MTNQQTRIDSLDFDQIKANLIDFLRSQDQFKGFDFEGSAMNILIDLLSYNTMYLAYYANMVANESFLDSAVNRSSVVSLAKQLGYTPRSKKSSRTLVNISIQSPTTTLINNVRRGTVFVTRGDTLIGIKGTDTIQFTVVEDAIMNYESGECIARDVDIRQGSLSTYRYVASDGTQRFRIPTKNADIDSLRVRVQKSITDTQGLSDIWTKVNDLNNLQGDSKVFFVQEGIDGWFEVYFGDGILGTAIEYGNVVMLEYLTIGDVSGDDIENFTYNQNVIIGSYGRTTSVTAQFPSTGYSDPETIRSIKYNAPRNYQAQERAVTAEDYRTILSREFADSVESFLVWGGEENDPPAYGKVFISIKPKTGIRLTTTEKLAIQKTIIGPRNIVSILPQVVDPDYIYINPEIEVVYNPSKTSLTATAIAAVVSDQMSSFEDTYLALFGRDYRQSQLQSFITDLDPSIVSCKITTQLQKRIEPFLGVPSTYAINFDNPLYHPVDGYPAILSSSVFEYQDLSSSETPVPNTEAYLDDDGYGNVRIYKLVGQEKVYIHDSIGTIDYDTGMVSLTNFNPQFLTPRTRTDISIVVQPKNPDVLARRNQIISFDMEQGSVTIVPQSFRASKSETGAPFPNR